MKILRQIADDEMIAVFLKAEIFSPRFRSSILPLLRRYHVSKDVLINPDINNPKQNDQRRKILGGYRGYQQYSLLFRDFPDNVTWYRALISREELNKIKYINDKYWNKLAGDGRYAKNGAENIKKDTVVYQVPNDGFWSVASDVEKGKKFDELILVGKHKKDELVILEGHERITGFLLKPENLPKKLEIIAGISKDIVVWTGYRDQENT